MAEQAARSKRHTAEVKLRAAARNLETLCATEDDNTPSEQLVSRQLGQLNSTWEKFETAYESCAVLLGEDGQEDQYYTDVYTVWDTAAAVADVLLAYRRQAGGQAQASPVQEFNIAKVHRDAAIEGADDSVQAVSDYFDGDDEMCGVAGDGDSVVATADIKQLEKQAAKTLAGGKKLNPIQQWRIMRRIKQQAAEQSGAEIKEDFAKHVVEQQAAEMQSGAEFKPWEGFAKHVVEQQAAETQSGAEFEKDFAKHGVEQQAAEQSGAEIKEDFAKHVVEQQAGETQSGAEFREDFAEHGVKQQAAETELGADIKVKQQAVEQSGAEVEEAFTVADEQGGAFVYNLINLEESDLVTFPEDEGFWEATLRSLIIGSAEVELQNDGGLGAESESANHSLTELEGERHGAAELDLVLQAGVLYWDPGEQGEPTEDREVAIAGTFQRSSEVEAQYNGPGVQVAGFLDSEKVEPSCNGPGEKFAGFQSLYDSGFEDEAEEEQHGGAVQGLEFPKSEELEEDARCGGDSFPEQEELQMIEANLHVDPETREVKFEYPLIKDPWLLSDNRGQAVAMAGGLERRLERSGRMQDYNAEMEGSVDRGVFAILSKEDMQEWPGPVNLELEDAELTHTEVGGVFMIDQKQPEVALPGGGAPGNLWCPRTGGTDTKQGTAMPEPQDDSGLGAELESANHSLTELECERHGAAELDLVMQAGVLYWDPGEQGEPTEDKEVAIAGTFQSSSEVEAQHNGPGEKFAGSQTHGGSCDKVVPRSNEPDAQFAGFLSSSEVEAQCSGPGEKFAGSQTHGGSCDKVVPRSNEPDAQFAGFLSSSEVEAQCNGPGEKFAGSQTHGGGFDEVEPHSNGPGAQFTSFQSWGAEGKSDKDGAKVWAEVEEKSAKHGTEWKFVPPGAQIRNGLAEARVKAIKQTLDHMLATTLVAGNPTLHYSELVTVLAQAANIVNDRPIGAKLLTEGDLVPTTVNQLLLGRTSTTGLCHGAEEAGEENFQAGSVYHDNLLNTWWGLWKQQGFGSLLPYYRLKDARRHVNLRAGDVCLAMYDNKVKNTYRLCRIVKIIESEDGLVRTVRVGYRQRRASGPLAYKSGALTEMEVAVQRLVLLVPEEELETAERI